MALEIPVRRVEGLPDSVEVGFSVGGPRRAIGRGLSNARHRGQYEHDCCRDACYDQVAKPISHRTGPQSVIAAASYLRMNAASIDQALRPD